MNKMDDIEDKLDLILEKLGIKQEDSDDDEDLFKESDIEDNIENDFKE